MQNNVSVVHDLVKFVKSIVLLEFKLLLLLSLCACVYVFIKTMTYVASISNIVLYFSFWDIQSDTTSFTIENKTKAKTNTFILMKTHIETKQKQNKNYILARPAAHSSRCCLLHIDKMDIFCWFFSSVISAKLVLQAYFHFSFSQYKLQCRNEFKQKILL